MFTDSSLYFSDLMMTALTVGTLPNFLWRQNNHCRELCQTGVLSNIFLFQSTGKSNTDGRSQGQQSRETAGRHNASSSVPAPPNAPYPFYYHQVVDPVTHAVMYYAIGTPPQEQHRSGPSGASVDHAQAESGKDAGPQNAKTAAKGQPKSSEPQQKVAQQQKGAKGKAGQAVTNSKPQQNPKQAQQQTASQKQKGKQAPQVQTKPKLDSNHPLLETLANDNRRTRKREAAGRVMRSVLAV